MQHITSRQNAIVKRFRELARAPHDGEVLLDGEHLLQEALACGVPVEVAAFADRRVNGNARSPLVRMADDVKKNGGRVVSVTDEVLAAMSPVQHPSGVVAIAHPMPGDLRAIFRAPGASPPSGSHPAARICAPGSDPARAVTQPLVVVLAGLQDPGNVGTIVRTAAAFGATGIVTVEGSADPFGWKALRGAMGGTFRLPVAARGTIADVTASARDAKVRLVAAVPRGGTPLPRVDLRQPSAILLGGEGPGLNDAVLRAADETVTIPMRAPVESLNVAVAAALLLYEASRQREDAR
jgi:TrmH family RNA methyltransferase